MHSRGPVPDSETVPSKMAANDHVTIFMIRSNESFIY